MTEEEIRNFVKRIADIEEVLEKLTPPTLDQILDKINEVGINNLTEIETQLLNEYSKG
jgi:predicted metal-dependent TIM-barrel fold hydrolase